MKIVDSYYIKRNGVYVWLSYLVKPEATDEVVEVRPMLCAEDGMVLYKGEEEVGNAVWLKDGNVDDYTEREPISIPEEEVNN